MRCRNCYIVYRLNTEDTHESPSVAPNTGTEVMSVSAGAAGCSVVPNTGTEDAQPSAVHQETAAVPVRLDSEAPALPPGSPAAAPGAVPHEKDCNLLGADAAFDTLLFARNLSTHELGRTILMAESTGSTNDDAKKLGSEFPHGTLLIAREQTGGKGRIDRRWSSPPGGLYMSLVLKPPVPPEHLPLLSIVAGYSVVSALRSAFRLDARLKWPNDVLVNGKKICGVLCEMTLQPESSPIVVAGIGVNVGAKPSDLPPEVRDTSSSLRIELGRQIELEEVAAAILNHFEPAYEEYLCAGEAPAGEDERSETFAGAAGPFCYADNIVKAGDISPLTERINRVLAYRGEQVVIRNVTAADRAETQGILVGLDSSGRVVLATATGHDVVFSAGDLSLRPLDH